MVKYHNGLLILISYLFLAVFLILSCNEKKNSNKGCEFSVIGKREYIRYFVYHPLNYSINKHDYDELLNSFAGNMISKQIIFQSKICTAAQSVSSTIFGIDINKDPLLQKINIIAGDYSQITSKHIIIARKLAELLSIETEDRVILFFTDYYGDLNSFEFVVKGIYELELDYRIDAVININEADSILNMNNNITDFIVYNYDEDVLADVLKKNNYDLDIYCLSN